MDNFIENYGYISDLCVCVWIFHLFSIEMLGLKGEKGDDVFVFVCNSN